jgi:hypothetical protein
MGVSGTPSIIIGSASSGESGKIEPLEAPTSLDSTFVAVRSMVAMSPSAIPPRVLRRETEECCRPGDAESVAMSGGETLNRRATARISAIRRGLALGQCLEELRVQQPMLQEPTYQRIGHLLGGDGVAGQTVVQHFGRSKRTNEFPLLRRASKERQQQMCECLAGRLHGEENAE